MIQSKKSRIATLVIAFPLFIGCNPPGTFTVPANQKKIGNRGFLIDIPSPNCPIRSMFPRPNVASYDFFVKSKSFHPAEIFSIEWISRENKPLLSDAEVYEYWKNFLPNYLSKNFGDGRYTIQFSQPFEFQNQYTATVAVGSGTHNGGGSGSIYLFAIYMGHHWAMIYSINDSTLDLKKYSLTSFSSLRKLPAFIQFEEFANSFTQNRF